MGVRDVTTGVRDVTGRSAAYSPCSAAYFTSPSGPAGSPYDSG